MVLIKKAFKFLGYSAIFWIAFHVCVKTVAVAQNSSLPKVIPPSPNAASLGKFGDMSVGYYTGTPSISIPLYNLKAENFTLPISLSYHASGIRVKVEEEAGLLVSDARYRREGLFNCIGSK